MNTFRRQLIEEAWTNVGEWITPIREDSDGLHFLRFDPWLGDWKTFRPKREFVHAHHSAFQFMAAGLALAKKAGFEDPDAVPDDYYSAFLLPSLAQDPYRGNGDPIQTISDWIDQHPYAAPAIAKLESVQRREELTALAYQTRSVDDTISETRRAM